MESRDLNGAVEFMKDHLLSTVIAMERDRNLQASTVQFIHNGQQYDLIVTRSKDQTETRQGDQE